MVGRGAGPRVLRGSHVESAVLAALTDDVTTNIPQSHSRAPFPLRAAGSFDGARIDQAVSVTPFDEGKERFCLIEIRDVSGAVDRERELSLLLMDIDSFKAYNDHFGHQQGDTCLSTVAQALAGMLKRPADIAARYGGEEFAAILRDTSPEQARAHANAIREHVGSLAIAHAPAAMRPHLTLSIGVVSFDKERLNDASTLIDAADKAL
jgi:diguanylate cyclase (GGDEF)-like protein